MPGSRSDMAYREYCEAIFFQTAGRWPVLYRNEAPGPQNSGARLVMCDSTYFQTAGRRPDSVSALRAWFAKRRVTSYSHGSHQPELKPKSHSLAGWLFGFEHSVLAPTYSPLASTIGSRGLNFRVRKENGCDPSDKAPTQNVQRPIFLSGNPLRNNGSPLAGTNILRS